MLKMLLFPFVVEPHGKGKLFQNGNGNLCVFEHRQAGEIIKSCENVMSRGNRTLIETF